MDSGLCCPFEDHGNFAIYFCIKNKMLNTEQESGWLLTETLCKGKSSQAFCPSTAAFTECHTGYVGLEKSDVLGMDGLDIGWQLHSPICCWWKDMAQWDGKKIVGWLSFLCPCFIRKCLWNLFTTCGETLERRDKWKSRDPMGDTRTLSGTTHFPGWLSCSG